MIGTVVVADFIGSPASGESFSRRVIVVNERTAACLRELGVADDDMIISPDMGDDDERKAN